MTPNLAKDSAPPESQTAVFDNELKQCTQIVISVVFEETYTLNLAKYWTPAEIRTLVFDNEVKQCSLSNLQFLERCRSRIVQRSLTRFGKELKKRRLSNPQCSKSR